MKQAGCKEERRAKVTHITRDRSLFLPPWYLKSNFIPNENKRHIEGQEGEKGTLPQLEALVFENTVGSTS